MGTGSGPCSTVFLVWVHGRDLHMAGATFAWPGRLGQVGVVISPLAPRRDLAPGSSQVGGVEARRLRIVRVLLLELLQARSATLRNVRGVFTN